MKEFEQWAKTQKPYDPFCCHHMMELAWKAALEWILREVRDMNYFGSENDIIFELEKELSDE